MRWVYISLILLSWSFRSFAIIPFSQNPANPFPSTSHIKKQKWFWEEIFQKYPSTSVVLHDSDLQKAIIDIINFEDLRKRRKWSGLPSRKQKQKIVQRYLKRYRLGMKRFKLYGKKALKYGPMEQRLFKIYSRSHLGLRRLYRGQAEIRSQTGLSDSFLIAAKKAQAYLPFMGQIFKQKKLPKDLIYIPFVESMFQLDAYSKVGAAGIWQFMPATGRKYLIVNSKIDERLSPYKSTVAAAKFLKDNYSRLKTWPLAVTAYNHGPNGLLAAINRTRTRSLTQIIKTYRSPSFRYASKNFYAEFLAARDTYKKIAISQNFNHRQSLTPVTMRLKKPMKLAKLSQYLPLSHSLFRAFNPGIRNKAWKRRQSTVLPTGFKFYLPKDVFRRLKTHKTASLYKIAEFYFGEI